MESPAEKRERKMIERYGSPEAVAQKRKEWQAKSRLNYKGTGGFANMDKDKARKIQSMGGKRRWQSNSK